MLKYYIQGQIMNVLSVWKWPNPIKSAGATKFALEGLTESLRQELKVFGISVTLLRPGQLPHSDVAQCCLDIVLWVWLVGDI